MGADFASGPLNPLPSNCTVYGARGESRARRCWQFQLLASPEPLTSCRIRRIPSAEISRDPISKEADAPKLRMLLWRGPLKPSEPRQLASCQRTLRAREIRRVLVWGAPGPPARCAAPARGDGPEVRLIGYTVILCTLLP